MQKTIKKTVYNLLKEEKKLLKEQGVDMKDRKAVISATAELRANQKAEQEAKAKAEKETKVTTEKLLIEIRDLLKEKEASTEKPKKATVKSKAKK